MNQPLYLLTKARLSGLVIVAVPVQSPTMRLLQVARSRP